MTLDAVVVGAGAAGLAAGLELARAGLDVRVLDAGERPGGVIRSERVSGYLLERGPNSLQVKPAARELLEAHGTDASLVAAAPASRLRFLWHEGRLEPVPMSPLAFLRTPLLSGRAKLRLVAEPFVRRGDGRDESVAEFVSRRLGPEALERLVAPFLGGVYAGDESQLGAEAVFPSLVAGERSHGSIVRGALAGMRRGGPRGLAGSWSTADGLSGLADRLAESLGERLCRGVRVGGIARDGAVWRVEAASTATPASLAARRLVLAVPSNEAAALLGPLDAEAASLAAGVAWAPIASVSLGVGEGDTTVPIRGFGFLVPRRAGLDVLGCLFMSRLFSGRAPAGRVLLTCFLGGARAPALVEKDDDAIRDAVRRDLERTLGLRADPQWLALTRWPRAVAQPGREHVGRIAVLRERISRWPGLALAGSWLDGVSLGDTLACGARAADAVRAGGPSG